MEIYKTKKARLEIVPGAPASTHVKFGAINREGEFRK